MTKPMAPSPEPIPDNGSARSTGQSPDGPKFWFVALYPLVAGAALMVVGLFALMGLLYNEASYAVLFVMGALVVIGGAHLWLQRILEGRDEPRPWQLPTVLSTAMALGTFVSVLPIFLGVDLPLPLPLVCSVFCMLGACVFSLGPARNRLVLALGAILGAALLLVGSAWWLYGQEREERKEELLQDVADFPHEIAVLDGPGWEPSQMWFSDTQRATLIYEPAEFSRETDGFQLRLQTELMDPSDERPLHDRCESEGGEHECEEHGDIVHVDRSSASVEEYEARAEFTDGLMAQLWTHLPRDHQGAPTMDAPDIDMVSVAEQIRPAEPGEDEEVVADIFR